MIESEAMAQAPIALGDNAVTSAGDLAARWVIHAAVMGQDLRTDADIIARATYNALQTAERLGARSLALPAFGTGVGGFPLYACAEHDARAGAALPARAPALRPAASGPRGLRRRRPAAFKNAMAGLSRYGITPAKHNTFEF